MPGRGGRRVSSSSNATHRPRPSELRRWRQYLANERAEAAIYRQLAQRRTGEERAILLELADAEARHEQHWLNLLGDQVDAAARVPLRTRLLAFLARHFGFVFVLALIQRSETRSRYDEDLDATPRMAADEHIHCRGCPRAGYQGTRPVVG